MSFKIRSLAKLMACFASLGIWTGCEEPAPPPKIAGTGTPATTTSFQSRKTLSGTATAEVAQPDKAEVLKTIEPAPVAFSPELTEVVKLVQAGIDEKVIVAFIQNSTNIYNLSQEDLLQLNDLGVSGSVMSEMINHSNQLREKMAKAVAAAAAAPAVEPPKLAPVPAPAPVAPVAPPVVGEAPVVAAPAGEQPTIIYSPPPTVVTVVTPPPSLPVQYVPYYQTLSPYGSWVDVSGYGWCWQPTVVVSNRRWRPYSERGHWVYSDCGWYWQSDYSWGWLPFHYGRWLEHTSCGWVWVPGNVWSPAWVSWRHSDRYCGWAPLPPAARFDARIGGFTFYNKFVGFNFEFGLGARHYTFVSLDRMCDRNPYYFALPASHAESVFHQTTVINNYVIGNNNTIINNGVPAQRVAAVSRSEIRKAEVRPWAVAAPGARPEHVERDGANMVIYRTNPEDVQRINRREVAKIPESTPASGGRMDRTVPALRPGSDTTATSTTTIQPIGIRSRPQAVNTGQALRSDATALTSPQPVTSVPQPLAPPQPVTGTIQPLAPQRPVTSSSTPLSTPRVITSFANSVTPPQPVTGTIEPLRPNQPVTSAPQPLAAPRPITSSPAPLSSPRVITSFANPVTTPQPITGAPTPKFSTTQPPRQEISRPAPSVVAQRNSSPVVTPTPIPPIQTIPRTQVITPNPIPPIQSIPRAQVIAPAPTIQTPVFTPPPQQRIPDASPARPQPIQREREIPRTTPQFAPQQAPQVVRPAPTPTPTPSPVQSSPASGPQQSQQQRRPGSQDPGR